MIYITGDMHADVSRVLSRNLKRLKKDDYLIICGDFGFIWEGTPREMKILKQIGKFKFHTLFLDGSHENFDLLNSYGTVDFCGGKAQKISGNLYHLIRGQIYTFCGKTVFCFGGGESPDRDIKSSAGNWWKSELPTITEMKSGVNNLNSIGRNVDLIISHEPPGKIKSLIYGNELHTNILNRFLDDVAKEVSFKTWYFGSVHLNKKFTPKYISVFDETISLK